MGDILFKLERMEEGLEKPEYSLEFRTLIGEAHEYLTKQQDTLRDDYGLSFYEDWYYDQETGIIEFSTNGEVLLKIEYEEVGSVSKVSNTWLWAWANPHLSDLVKSEIELVRRFGLENTFEALTRRKWYADEVDGWEMTSVASYLFKALGAYRVPTENAYSYMIFKKIDDCRVGLKTLISD